MHLFDHPSFAWSFLERVALSRSRLFEEPAGPPLRDTVPSTCRVDRLTYPERAQKFPSATSFNTRMSSVCSATIFFSSEFSRSSWRSFFIWSVDAPE